MFLKLSLLLFLNSYVFGDDLRVVNVVTTAGQIDGLVGDDFTMFLGIPYGVIDEKNPFGTAEPHPNFTTRFQAFNDSAICPQIVKGVPGGTIHCLHLNVYTPKLYNPGQTLPVMVYIHGGAFVEGNGRVSTYSPKFLVRHDVIVVTVNYRLGPYGHLCFPNSEYSNQAFKDQHLAIKWVKNNIYSFGGDPDNILLFGHSSGSISTEINFLYNNNNLFNKVIFQSGHFVSPICNEVTKSDILVKQIGMDTENINVDSFIKKISAIETNTLIDMTKNMSFGPCFDGVLITKTPRMRNFSNVKIMIGVTSKEMLYFYPNADTNFYNNFDFAAELDKGFFKMANSAANEVKQFYSGDLKENVVNFISDFAFNYPMERAGRYYLGKNATVYRYLFSYDGGRNYMKIREHINDVGSTHGDELGYLFDMPIFGSVTPEDQDIIDWISVLWTNFAKYGDPTPPSVRLPIRWKPVTASSQPYLQIDNHVVLHYNPFQSRVAFWDTLYAKYGIYAKGICLGEKWGECTVNSATSVDISCVLLISVMLFKLRV